MKAVTSRLLPVLGVLLLLPMVFTVFLHYALHVGYGPLDPINYVWPWLLGPLWLGLIGWLMVIKLKPREWRGWELWFAALTAVVLSIGGLLRTSQVASGNPGETGLIVLFGSFAAQGVVVGIMLGQEAWGSAQR